MSTTSLGKYDVSDDLEAVISTHAPPVALSVVPGIATQNYKDAAGKKLLVFIAEKSRESGISLLWNPLNHYKQAEKPVREGFANRINLTGNKRACPARPPRSYRRKQGLFVMFFFQNGCRKNRFEKIRQLPFLPFQVDVFFCSPFFGSR